VRLRSANTAAILAALLHLGCAAKLPPLAETVTGQERVLTESLRRSVEKLAERRTNLGRYEALELRVEELGLAERARSEWIDWFSVQRNLLVEIPGSSPRIVYVVAHYDKVDASPLSTVSVLLNGLLDPLIAPLTLSTGAVDNATGVAVALELAADASERAATRRPSHTFRFLFVGAEEMGLRGSRAHVARLPDEEKDAIELAVVLDSMGLAATPNCILDDVSHPGYSGQAREIARELGMPLDSGRLPVGATSDFEPFQRTSFGADFLRGLKFNLIGGLLPQRSWFTGSHSAPVLFFSGCELLGIGDYVASLLALPFGSLHGAGDRASRVDPRRLYEQLSIASRFLREIGALRSEELEQDVELERGGGQLHRTDPPRPTERSR
jgi:hypothetical protein